MRLLPINITGAKVTALSFEFSEDDSLPTFRTCVALYDNYGKRITTIQISNQSWDTLGKCEMTIDLVELAGKVRRELESVVTTHMNKQNKTLEMKGQDNG